MVERIRLVETFRNLFYTPIYVAVAGGFFYRQSLNVLFSTTPADDSPTAMLKDGSADIAQTGISRSLMALDEGDEDAPLHFAEINQRDGFSGGSQRDQPLGVASTRGHHAHPRRLHACALDVSEIGHESQRRRCDQCPARRGALR